MADVLALVDQYKVQFTKAGQKLVEACNNAPQKMKQLKQKATELHPSVQSWIESAQNQIKTLATDFAPVGIEIAFHKAVLEIYTLVAIGLLAATVGHVMGGMFLGALIGSFFDTTCVFTMALIVLPIATVYTVRKTAEISKEDRILLVISSAFCSSVLLGYLLSKRYLGFASPPMFVLPLAIGLGGVFLGPRMGNQPRANFVGACLGGAVGFYFVFGLITGNLNGAYFIWMNMLTGIAFLDYQIKVARLYDGSASLATDATFSITTYLAAGFLLSLTFASTSPQND